MNDKHEPDTLQKKVTKLQAELAKKQDKIQTLQLEVKSLKSQVNAVEKQCASINKILDKQLNTAKKKGLAFGCESIEIDKAIVQQILTALEANKLI